MKKLKQILLILLYSFYGLYAGLAFLVCFVLGGVIVLITPWLALRRAIARWTLRAAFYLSAMPYRVKGPERPWSKTCVVIANHRSYLDGLALIAALPPHFSAVIKHEMAEVPFIGWFLRRIGCRFVARQPELSAGADTRILLDALEAGESLAIFPEGTFSTDLGLLPFHDGAFFLAAKAGVPVVPVAIEGARKILPDGRFLPWPGELTVSVFAQLEADGEDRESIDRLRDKAESVLSHRLKSRPVSQHREKHDYDYYREIFAERRLPLSYLDLDLLEMNIRSVLERSASKKLRIDARMLQCPGVLQRVMRSHTRFHGIKCSTVDEAAHLLPVADLADVLVAYPTVQSAALDQACAAIGDGHLITLTVDSPLHLAPLAEAAKRGGIVMPVCVEIDMSMAPSGMQGPGRRSAIRTNETLLQLVEAIDHEPGLRFRGVVTYDTQRNHLAEWMANNADDTDSPLSKRTIERLRKRRHAIVKALRDAGHEDILFNCDGTSGMAFNAGHTAVTEITVGPALFGLDPEDRRDVPAAGLAAEIIRRTDRNRYACLVGGHAARYAAHPKLLPQPYLPQGARLDEMHGAGVAQIPIRYEGKLTIGDMIFLHPSQTGELCERFSKLLLVQDGTVVSETETYRV